MNHKNISYLTLDDLNGESLEHYGIPGQKWGIRRYQNEDGSLTEAGKKHYYGKGRIERGNRKIDRYSKKLETADPQKANDLRKKIAREKDRNAFREKVRERHEARSTGSKIVHNLLLGPYANLAVNNMRQAGYDEITTYGATIAAGLLTGSLVGNAIVARLAMNQAVDRKDK